jgi:hypothetical protein
VPAAVSFEGGPEEPVLGVPASAPVPPPAEEPQPEQEQFVDEAVFAEESEPREAAEPQMLTAQIVMEQIEVVHILPREP